MSPRPGECKTEGCDSDTVVALNLCNKCYLRLKKHGDVTVDKRTKEKLDCSHSECDRASETNAAGMPLCLKHYKRWKRYGTIEKLGTSDRTNCTPRTTRKCKIEGCESFSYHDYMCRVHWGKTNEERTARRALSGPERLQKRIDKYLEIGQLPDWRQDLGPCTIWTGPAQTSGHGQINIGSKLVMVHRYIYESEVGPIPDGLHIDHLCRRVNCQNVKHMEPVTHGENARRARECARCLYLSACPLCRVGIDPSFGKVQQGSGTAVKSTRNGHNPPPFERLMMRTDTDGPIPLHRPELGQCWVWLGSLDTHGYGSIRVEGRLTKTHRFSYEHFIGPIPDGLTLDHLCSNRACCRPSHLEPVTLEDNSRRRHVCDRCLVLVNCPHCGEKLPTSRFDCFT